MVDLMGYSVLVDNEEQAKKLQEIAFEQGFEWKYGYEKVKNLDERSFQFGYGGEKLITYSPSGEHYQDNFITKKAHFNELFGGKFTPIAMKCTQEQFDAIVPKLKGCRLEDISSFKEMPYLINNRNSEKNNITNYFPGDKALGNRKVYEEWNEELFLKACGIEVESLEQQLEKAKAEVARLEKAIEEKNRPNIGDWLKRGTKIFKVDNTHCLEQLKKDVRLEKVTDQELINKLNELIK